VRPVVAKLRDQRFDDSVDQSFLPFRRFRTTEGRKSAGQQMFQVLRDDIVGIVRIDIR
jgi:hypothetical protein